MAQRLVAITAAGDELAGFDGAAGPAAHMKVFLPGPDGPEAVMRTYTVRRFDPGALELEIEFFLHGDGPASAWAADCRPGDPITVAGPRGTYRPADGAAWRLLAGDESSLPAIASILEALGPGAAGTRVLVEVGDRDDEVGAAPFAAADVTWLHRDGQEPGRRLADAVRAEALGDGDGEVWVGCEAAAMRDIRAHLLGERGLARDAIHTRGYWKVGAANHPDHDTGDD